jgi:hypothetical protein
MAVSRRHAQGADDRDWLEIVRYALEPLAKVTNENSCWKKRKDTVRDLESVE